METTSKRVGRLRANHNKTPDYTSINGLKNANTFKLNRSIDFNDRDSLSHAGTMISETVSPFSLGGQSSPRR